VRMRIEHNDMIADESAALREWRILAFAPQRDRGHDGT